MWALATLPYPHTKDVKLVLQDDDRIAGADACGLTQLASRTVGVPFVGLTAGAMVIAELLRRLNGGMALELIAGSVAALDAVESVLTEGAPYAFGHVATG